MNNYRGSVTKKRQRETRKWVGPAVLGWQTGGAQRDSKANPKVTCGRDLHKKIKIKYMVQTIGRNAIDLNYCCA